jgi:hypothetical protein
MYPVDFINPVQAYILIQRTGNRRIQKITRENLYFLFFMEQFKMGGAIVLMGKEDV